jgi:hypothetical protein
LLGIYLDLPIVHGESCIGSLAVFDLFFSFFALFPCDFFRLPLSRNELMNGSNELLFWVDFGCVGFRVFGIG